MNHIDIPIPEDRANPQLMAPSPYLVLAYPSLVLLPPCVVLFLHLNHSSDPFQMKKMSSMNLLHMCTAAPAQAANNPVSNHPIKMQANVGATLVPIAVPYIWSQNDESKMKRLQVSTNIRSVIKNSVGSFGSGRNLLLFKASLNTSMPWPWGMLVYSPTTSAVTRMALPGCGPFSFSSFRSLRA